MPASVRFVVPGRPVGKGRPRVTVRRGVAIAYTPESTRAFEQRVAWATRAAFRQPLAGPLGVRIVAVFAPPASWSRRKREGALDAGWCAGRPDVDNVVKAVLDGMAGIAYLDDSQVVALSAAKKYGHEDCVCVAVRAFSQQVSERSTE